MHNRKANHKMKPQVEQWVVKNFFQAFSSLITAGSSLVYFLKFFLSVWYFLTLKLMVSNLTAVAIKSFDFFYKCAIKLYLEFIDSLHPLGFRQFEIDIKPLGKSQLCFETIIVFNAMSHSFTITARTSGHFF